MLITILFLTLLFIVSLIYTFSYLPTDKFIAWIKSLFFVKSTPLVATQPTATVSHQKRVNSSVRNKPELKNIFSTFDKNKDGFITKQELKELLKNIGISVEDEDAVDMVRRVDSNGDGMIDLDEFCKLLELMTSEEGVSGEDGEKGDGEADLKEAFDVFDGDKDGLITVAELGLVLSSLGFMEGKKLEVCKEMINKVDVDGDGMVNFDEFKRMMKAGGNLTQLS